MRDFKKRKLYENEIGRFKYVIENRIETKTEYNNVSKNLSGHEEEDEDPVWGADSPFAGMSDISSGGFDDFGDIGSSLNFGNSGGPDDSWRLNKPMYEQFIYSLPYICKIVTDEISDGKHTKEEWENVLAPIQAMSVILFSLSLMAKVFGFNTPHIPMLGIFIGLTGFVAAVLVEYQVYHKGLIARFKGEEIAEDGVENTELNDEETPLNGLFNFEDTGEVDLFNMGDSDNLFQDSGDDLSFNEEEPIEHEDDEDEDDAEDLLNSSPVNVYDEFDFKHDLLKQFERNSRYKGVYLKSRKELIDSFAGLMVTNDKKFSTWITEREHSVVYDNIAYTLYKALSDINRAFENAEGHGSNITIMDIQSSPLMYKIELKLPNKYFKPAAIERSVETFENYLKVDASDTQVQCLIATSGDMYTIRLLRLDYKGLISIGDILRYRDDSEQTPYEKFINPKLGAPMLVGLRDNEYPHIVDLEANTAMAIVGGSGSGKSWLTYELGVNLIVSNDYNEVNFVVLDAKNATFWKSFARMPHVLGYHSDVSKYLEIAQEIEAEMDRRQVLLNEYDFEDFVEARKVLKAEGDYERLKEFPLLVFIIDEITSTMDELEMMDEKKETWKAFRATLAKISQKGRSAGVRLLTIGQRSIDKSLPKNVRANSSMLFGMKMDATSDFNILFDNAKEVEKMKKPTGAGLGIMKSEDVIGFHNLKTLTPGGTNNKQIRTVLRIMSFDWLRRAAGRDDLYVMPVKTEYNLAYNRPIFLDESYAEMAEGRILSKTEVNTGYEINLLSDAKEIKAQKQNSDTFTKSEKEQIILENKPEPVPENKPTPTIKEPVSVEEPVIKEDLSFLDTDLFETNDFIEDSDSSDEPNNNFVFPDLTDFINNMFPDEQPIENSAIDEELEDDEEEIYEAIVEEVVDVEDDVEDVLEFEEEHVPIVPETVEETSSSLDMEELERKKREIFNRLNEDKEQEQEVETVEVKEITPQLEDIESSYSESNSFDAETTYLDDILNDEEDTEDLAVIDELPTETEPVIPEKVVKPIKTPEPEVIKVKPVVANPEPKVEKLVSKPVKKDIKASDDMKKALKDLNVEPNINKNVQLKFKSEKVNPIKETPNMSIQEYIITHGVETDTYESSLPKEVVEKVYTARQISKAINKYEIMSTKDSYTAQL